MEDNNTSPVVPVNKEARMWFSEALREVLKGKQITRKAWENTNIFVMSVDGKLIIVNESGIHSWILSNEDILAEDWVTREGNTPGMA